MPGFHTTRPESPVRQPSEGFYIKRRAISPTVARPGTPDPKEGEIIGHHPSIIRRTTPPILGSHRINGRTPLSSPDHIQKPGILDIKQWSLIWDNDKEDFVTVPYRSTDSTRKGDVDDKVPGDVDILDEFVFVLEQSTPMLELFEHLDVFRGPFQQDVPSILEKQQDPDSSFLELEEL